MKGNPRCPACNGRGVVPTAYGWTKCRCISGTLSSRRLQRYANGIGTEYVPLSERLRRQDEQKESE